MGTENSIPLYSPCLARRTLFLQKSERLAIALADFDGAITGHSLNRFGCRQILIAGQRCDNHDNFYGNIPYRSEPN